MTDTIMLGKLGETALSASALANQFISIFQICCMGIGMGASVLTSRFWGMQDKHSLRKAVTIMLRLCFIFGLAFTLATILAPEGLMRIYTSDPAIIQAGAQLLPLVHSLLLAAGLLTDLHHCASQRGPGKAALNLLHLRLFSSMCFLTISLSLALLAPLVWRWPAPPWVR